MAVSLGSISSDWHDNKNIGHFYFIVIGKDDIHNLKAYNWFYYLARNMHIES